MAKKVTASQFARIVRELPEDLHEAAIMAFRALGLQLERYVVEEILRAELVNKGELKASVKYTRLTDGSRVHVDAPHAAPQEYGARPFRPPLRPLAEWAIEKQYADDEDEAWAIARAIADRYESEGFKPKRFMGKAHSRVLQDAKVVVEGYLRKKL